MTKYRYVFGSICRGDFDEASDVDIIEISSAIRHVERNRHDVSVYSTERIQALWQVGHQFAWHLYLESKLVFTADGRDVLKELGKPKSYTARRIDIERYFRMFERSANFLLHETVSPVSEWAIIFSAMRNAAISHSVSLHDRPMFHRNAAWDLDTPKLAISRERYSQISACKLLATRGLGKAPSTTVIYEMLETLPAINDWFQKLLRMKAT